MESRLRSRNKFPRPERREEKLEWTRNWMKNARCALDAALFKRGFEKDRIDGRQSSVIEQSSGWKVSIPSVNPGNTIDNLLYLRGNKKIRNVLRIVDCGIEHASNYFSLLLLLTSRYIYLFNNPRWLNKIKIFPNLYLLHASNIFNAYRIRNSRLQSPSTSITLRYVNFHASLLFYPQNSPQIYSSPLNLKPEKFPSINRIDQFSKIFSKMENRE